MWLIGMLGLLVFPAFIPGLAVGALAWRRWQRIPGSVIPVLTFWAFDGDRFRGNDAIHVLPVAWVYGLIWSLGAHSLRRQLTA